MDEKSESINTPLDNIMAIIGIVSLIAFPLIIIEQIWIDVLPTAKLMGTDLVLFLVSTGYFKITMDKELEDRN